MKINQKDFARYLALYGPAVEQWPDSVRAEGLRMRQHPEAAALIGQQSRLETLLRNYPVEPPRAGFAERIIAATKYATPSPVSGFGAWLHAALAEFMLPRPAFALASLLALGFVIGLSAPAPTVSGDDDLSLQTYLENDGAVL